MKNNPFIKNIITFSALFVLVLIVSCVKNDTVTTLPNEAKAPQAAENAQPRESGPEQLPVRYMKSTYAIEDDEQNYGLTVEGEEDYTLKVGADIFSQEPMPLWTVMTTLADFKGMTVSFANDVNQQLPIYVSIKAEDDFSQAIESLLRSLDLFHTIENKAIFIQNKKTQVFYLSLPNMKGTYSSDIGGDFLSTQKGTGGTTGRVQVTSIDNKFDIWESIVTNLKILLNISEEGASLEREYDVSGSADRNTSGAAIGSGQMSLDSAKAANKARSSSSENYEQKEKSVAKATTIFRQTSLDGDFFIIDQSIGMITITAKPSLLRQVESYLNNLKRELYRQVVIEAKIIEVYLKDSSKIGIDWSSVLKDFNVSGLVEFGTGGLLGQVWPWNPPDEPKDSATYPSNYPSSFVSKISLGVLPFDVMLNALNEQGDATVLSNPKITVLNGQPALLSIGTNTTYISEISSDVDGNTGTISYTAQTDTVVEGIALGIMASITSDETVILHLSPVTTELVNGIIPYREFGEALSVGLPEVRVREMTTTVQVDNGEMLIIGGLIDSLESSAGEFAPLLGDIPFIRYLFGVEEKIIEKRELVILLTPRII